MEVSTTLSPKRIVPEHQNASNYLLPCTITTTAYVNLSYLFPFFEENLLSLHVNLYPPVFTEILKEAQWSLAICIFHLNYLFISFVHFPIGLLLCFALFCFVWFGLVWFGLFCLKEFFILNANPL